MELTHARIGSHEQDIGRSTSKNSVFHHTWDIVEVSLELQGINQIEISYIQNDIAVVSLNTLS